MEKVEINVVGLERREALAQVGRDRRWRDAVGDGGGVGSLGDDDDRLSDPPGPEPAAQDPLAFTVPVDAGRVEGVAAQLKDCVAEREAVGFEAALKARRTLDDPRDLPGDSRDPPVSHRQSLPRADPPPRRTDESPN